MTFRRLLTTAATLALAVTGVALPCPAHGRRRQRRRARSLRARKFPLAALLPSATRYRPAPPYPHRRADASGREARRMTLWPSSSPWFFLL